MITQLVTIREHTFFRSFLSHQSIVVDAGGNLGHFALAISRLTGAKVFVLEPVPNLFKQIPEHERIQKFEMALVPQSGTFNLNLSRNPESNSLRPLKSESHSGLLCVNGVSLSDFMLDQSIEKIDVLKIDIEGAEIEVLLSIDSNILSRVSQVTVEFHAHTRDLLQDQFKEIKRIHEVIKYLEDHGFMMINRSSPFFIDVLFLNRVLLDLSWIEKLSYKFLHEHSYRYTNALLRRFHR